MLLNLPGIGTTLKLQRLIFTLLHFLFILERIIDTNRPCHLANEPILTKIRSHSFPKNYIIFFRYTCTAGPENVDQSFF